MLTDQLNAIEAKLRTLLEADFPPERHDWWVNTIIHATLDAKTMVRITKDRL